MIWLGFLLMAGQPAPVFDAVTAPDEILATQRGGLRLPNGIDVAMTVQTTTAVDGAVVLETVWTVDAGQPQLAVYTPARGTPVASTAAPGGQGIAAASTSATVTYDRQHGIQVATNGWRPAVTVSGAPGAATPTAGLERVDPGEPVTTDGGVVSASAPGQLSGVQLAGMDIQVTHLNGQAFGSVIQNMGSDRVIDTQTTLSIDLRDAGPDVLGSAFLRVEALAVDALAGRIGS